MLHGSTEAIRIEDPGVEKAEFVVMAGSRREFHQVKRSHPSGKWSLAALGADGFLQTVGEALAGNSDRFVFASGSDARELSDLCEAAGHAESAEEFGHDFLAAKGRREQFARLIRGWACDVPTAVERLRRIEVRTIGDRDLERAVRWGVEALFVADPGKVVAELLKIVEDSMHRKVTRQELVEELAQRGYPLRRLPRPTISLDSDLREYRTGGSRCPEEEIQNRGRRREPVGRPKRPRIQRDAGRSVGRPGGR